MSLPSLQSLDKSTWQRLPFGEIAQSIGERVDPTTTDLQIYVGLKHIDPESIHIKRFGKREDVSGQKLRCYPGDVIFGRRRAYQRKAAICEFDGFCSAHALVLRAIPEVIDPKLFPFFLHSDPFMHRAVDISVGSLSPTINWTKLKKEEFLLPPKERQAKLAELLWAADAVVDRSGLARQRTLTAQKAAFHSSADAADKTQIKRVATVSNGTTPSTKHPEYWEQGNIPWLPSGKVHDKFVRASETFITDAAIEEKKAKIKPANSSLVAMCGQTRGFSAMLMIDSAINQSFACVTPKSIDPTFLFYALFFSYQQLRDISQGSAQLGLNCELVGNFKIPIPDEAIQAKTGNELLLAEDAIDRISEHLSSSRALLKSLINQIF